MSPVTRWFVGALSLGVLFSWTVTSSAETAYFIGNSFTHNCEPYSLPALAAQQSNNLTVGAHINSGSPLHNIWGRPDDAREVNTTFGRFREALPNHEWDVVTLQLFYKRPFEGFPQSTIQSDIDSIVSFINLARQNPDNSDTTFYIYASWPFLWTGKPFQEAWDADVEDELTTPTSHQREYFEHLIKRARAASDAEIYLIPIPEVMYALDQKMQDGEVSGFTGVADLLSDDRLHVNQGLGEYLVGATVYATIFGANPAGLVKPDESYEGGDNSLFTPEIYEVFHETIWDVISTHEYTGVVAEAESR